MTGKQWFARQKKEQIAQLTCQLDALLPSILRRHAFSKDNPDDFKSQQLSLHAKIGGKHTTYLNVTDNVPNKALLAKRILLCSLFAGKETG